MKTQFLLTAHLCVECWLVVWMLLGNVLSIRSGNVIVSPHWPRSHHLSLNSHFPLNLTVKDLISQTETLFSLALGLQWMFLNNIVTKSIRGYSKEFHSIFVRVSWYKKRRNNQRNVRLIFSLLCGKINKIEQTWPKNLCEQKHQKLFPIRASYLVWPFSVNKT